jgi:hypothetical protein
MSRRRKSTDTTPFDTLRLEGSLFVPELLERAASGEATFQKETDYAIPKGLKLHDEYGRAFRIAIATWQSFSSQTNRADLDAATITRGFVVDFLRQCLNYTDLTALGAPIQLGDRNFPVTAQGLGGRLPVVIAPHNVSLDDPDTHFAIVGSSSKKKSAHQLAQEFLNAAPDCLWAIVTNGKILRLLRDADTLTRPNFLEFDLETILRDDQHRYADFSALWRILHASRAGEPTAASADSIWEKWKSEGHAQGLRVRNGLRDGVQNALLTLGTGFLKHPDNTALRENLHNGFLTKEDYFQQLLRLIYRSLFLFCAEERDLLHPPLPDNESEAAKVITAHQTYATGYSLRRFRKRSLRQSAHDPHGDLWQSVLIVFRGLSGGQTRLALPALGGLFAETQCPNLDNSSITNRDLLSAMRELRWFLDPKSKKRSAIDYRNMGPEELGSVYESLLELVPTLDIPSRLFGFAGITDGGSTSGNARKTTGSYYTPDSLVQELIKSALDPVIAQKIADHPENPIEALLSITVCDPSCGSGHFLLAAARRLAEKLAELRAPDGAVRPDDYRHALREVASRCIYGVDINPMAVELCRVALWLETVDPGKPLGFLNHHIRSGNSLLGTTPDLIAAGLPDETFTAIEGDDKPACAELKKRNKAERTGFGPLFAKEEDSIREKLREAATSIEAMDDSQPDALQKKEAAFLTNETAPEYRHAKLLADLWCAAFVIKKTIRSNDTPVVSSSSQSPIPVPEDGQLLHTDDDLFGQPVPAAKPTAKPKSSLKTENFKLGTASGITTGTLRDFVQGKPLPEDLESEVTQLAEQYRFFHWHIAYPQVFAQGGFDCILGNPPWERVKLQEKEWYAIRRPEIAKTTNTSARKRLIESLIVSEPRLYQEFVDASRQAEGESQFLRASGRFPLCARGDINLYAIFAETNRTILANSGRAGCVLPSGIATDDTTKLFFQNVVETGSLVSLFDFENKDIFPSVHSSYKFCLFTAGSGKSPITESADLVFFAHCVDDVRDDARRLTLSRDDIALLNPNTRTCPIFRGGRDAELTKSVYRRIPVLVNEGVPDGNPWRVSIRRVLDMGQVKVTNLARTQAALASEGISRREGPNLIRIDESEFIPIYEGKMFGAFNHRAAGVVFNSLNAQRGAQGVDLTDEQLRDPHCIASPLYWFPKANLLALDIFKTPRRWLIAYKNITATTNERSMIAAILPFGGSNFSVRTVFFDEPDAELSACFLGGINSYVYDYLLRQSLGGVNLSDYISHQIAVPAPATYAQPCPWAAHPQSTIHDPPSLRDWLLPRVLELTYTAWDLEAFAQDCGWPGPPFRWDEDRRFLLRCELDAAFFHLYLGSEDEWRQQPEALTRAFPTPRHAVSYIMDTFPIVKRKDEAKHGTYRTKETILQIYDALAESMASGVPYQTLLSPPPADPACCHTAKS